MREKRIAVESRATVMDAPGEVNLGTLLRSMQPELLDGEFVFVTLTESA